MIDLLWILLVVPVVAAISVALLGPRRVEAVRWTSLAATLLCVLLAFVLAANLNTEASAAGTAGSSTLETFSPQFVTRVDLLPLGPGEIQFYIGMDGLNVWLVVLTTVLMVTSVLIS